VPTSTDKYRLVANRLVVFWWYGFHLKLAPSRLVHLFIGASLAPIARGDLIAPCGHGSADG
jgi:hypothetical protein